MSIDLRAQVLAVAEAMRERDAEFESAYRRHYYGENREYMKQRNKILYIRNIDRILLQKKAYYAKNSNAIADCKKAYYAANKELIADRQKAYYAKNSNAIADCHKAYRAANKELIADRDRAYRAANKELIADCNKAYYAANKDALAEKNREYRARKKSERVLVGRRKGESHPGAKLNDDLVRIIRSRSGAGESLRKIAENLGVSRGAVSHVLSGETWKHVI